jgi:hypothetical protein
MSQPSPLFNVVSVEDDAQQPQPQPSAQQQAVTIKMIEIALGAIWKQFVIAISRLHMIASTAAVFTLFYVNNNPNVNQLIMFGIFALFVLMANALVIRARK